MKRQSLMKRMGTFLLAMCFVLTMLVGAIPTKAQAAEGDAHTVYFKNSEGWETVGAYIWGAAVSDPLGGWPGVDATAATEVGEGWVQVSVPCAAPYHVILFNKSADSERVDVYIEGTDKVYTVLGSGSAFATKEEAEAFLNVEPPVITESYPIYFLNCDEWAEVGAYIYGDQGELLGGWGSTIATASDLGDNWLQVDVPAKAPYNIIFFNTTDDTQRAELYIDAADKIYVAPNAQAYTSKSAAEVAMGVAQTYPIYFLNSNEWAEVGAYIYGDQGELLGGWGSTIATASDLGDNWLQVNVPAEAPYNIILFNTADDTQRAELYIDAADKDYITVEPQAYTSKATAEIAMGIEQPSYPIYFLNSDEWAEVGAYIYGDQGELLGGWGSTIAAASELGGNWLQVNVPAEAPYNIIFFNTADDTQRTSLLIDAADKDYVTVNGVAFTSQADAEASLSEEPPVTETYPIYFLNSNEWAGVGAYIYGDQGELLGGWGSTIATASDLGGNWLQVNVPAEAPFSIIFFNTADPDNQRAELLIDAADKDYVTVNSAAFTTQADAEASLIPVTTYDLYFLNAYNWEGVGAYAYFTNKDGVNVEPLGSWGTSIATAATELGGKWMKVSATQEPPYGVIFYNTADDTQRVEYYIDAADKIYATVKNVAFASQAEAEAWNNSGVELWNMTLSDDLGVNFYLNVDETLAANTVATISVAGVECCNQSLAGMSTNADGYYAFSVDLAAAQMTDEVVVALWVGESNLYYNTYTIRGYADHILANDYSMETKALVRQMVEYGAAAQAYFGYSDNYANAGLDPVEQVAVPETATTEMSVSGNVDGISFYGASLVFESKVAVRFYFTVSGDINDYTFTVNGERYAPDLKGDMYYVEIADINPQKYETAITLNVNEALSVTYSPMNYIVRMSEKGSTELQTLLLAMYNYYLAACNL